MKKIKQLTARVTDREMLEWAEVCRLANLPMSDGLRSAMQIVLRDGPEIAALLLRNVSASGRKRRQKPQA